MTEHYDVIIIGSGAGGGTLAHALAGSGKSILLLERGDFLPREMDNWDPEPVFIHGKYISKDKWFDADGNVVRGATSDRRIGMDLQELRSMPHVIGIAAGSDKVTAIRAALRGGYLNALVTDEETAEQLLTAD